MWITDVWHSTFLGVRFFIWFYFCVGNMAFLSAIAYWYRERIRKKYYEIRFPEKIIKIIMHFSGNMYKEYYRLIPEEKLFRFENKDYVFTDPAILKQNKFYSINEKQEEIITIDGKKYNFNDIMLITKRWQKYPEIHYFFNIPNPINFNISKKSIDLSSFQLKDIHENDLVKKLLTLEGEKSLIRMLLLICIVNAVATGFVVAKLMGWV